MTLDEAIKHCKEKAEELRKEAKWIGTSEVPSMKKETQDCLECANEHEQLAGWLAELKERREADNFDPSTRPIARYITTLETMTAESEPGEDARLDADELDAVLFAIKILREVAK